jgi:hypothetical protein
MLVTAPAANALASTTVRFVNARGGSGSLGLEVAAGGRRIPAGSAAFGQSSGAVSVPAGEATLALSGSGASAKVKRTLSNGAGYTVVALPKGAGAMALDVLRNGSATGGGAKLRIVHAAPELGSPDIRLGSRTVAQEVKFRSATGYLRVDPASYRLVVAKPNGGRAVFKTRLALSAGTATTVVLAGSGGAATRVIQLNDATAAPSGAPHTGLGGLARGGGEPWLLALLAALLAGGLGGAAQLARARRSRS